MMQQLTPDTMVVATPHQVSCDVDNEAALLNLDTGVYYGLDPVGARIWKLLQERTTVRALIAAMVQDFDVTEEIAQQDLISFLTEMHSAGLVELQS